MTARAHDLVVIGAGPGGYIAAIRAAQLGMNVACVEQEAALGGTCLRIGCIPSKAMLESSLRYWEAKQEFATHGIQASQITLDLATMLRRKEQVVTTLTRGVDVLFKKNKITRYLGHGRINGPRLVTVENAIEGFELRAKNILIATGSTPAALRGAAIDGQNIGTSTEALSYSEVPKHLVVIGAEAQKLFQKQGLEFHLGRKVTGVSRKNGQCVVESEGNEPIRCDRVLV